MYKLLLALRYLRSRVIGWFAVLGVTLCVAMMVIPASVFSGFLDMVEDAAKGLYGDVVISAQTLSGLGRYDEFIALMVGGEFPLEAERWTRVDAGDGEAFEAKLTGGERWALRFGREDAPQQFTLPAGAELVADGKSFGRIAGELTTLPDGTGRFRPERAIDRRTIRPGEIGVRDVRVRLDGAVGEVSAATPFILTFGILRVPRTDYRQTVQIAGVRLPNSANVTDFEEGLVVQHNAERPDFSPSPEQMLRALERIGKNHARIEQMLGGGDLPAASEPEVMLRRLRNAEMFRSLAAERIRSAAADAGLIDRLAKRSTALREKLARLEQDRDADPAALEALETELEQVELDLARLQRDRFDPPGNRVILGLGIPGLAFKTPTGETVRVIMPGNKVMLSLLPLGRKMSMTELSPNTQTFTVVDDHTSGVWHIDKEIVYLPFETLQALNNMQARRLADGTRAGVDRASAIHVKVAGGWESEAKLRRVRDEIAALWEQFHRRYPDATKGFAPAAVQTWRQRQGAIIAQVESQRIIVLIMFGIISVVAIALILVISYMIVVQKTRDIGVLKAVGASSGGVAGIFLGYGAAIGLTGSILGTAIGYLFVRNINAIHDWVGQVTGRYFFTREQFMFESIPNEMDWSMAIGIVLASVVGGLAGTLLPALRAARMQPVEALRYE